jgi:outer membrane receptor protein involved in Fe transport
MPAHRSTRRWATRLWSALCVLWLLVAASGPARGQGVANEADLLFRRGGELFTAQKYDDALLAFLGSNRLVRNKNALYNIALCYLRLSDYREAFRFLSEYEKEPLSDAERAVVRRQTDQIRSRLALVRVASDPPGATVYVDRKDLGAVGLTPITVALPPGAHTVIVELGGHHEERRPAAAQVGRTVVVEVPVRRILGGVDVAGTPAAAEVRVDRDHGPPAGVVPAHLELAPGRHALYVSREGYRAARSDVDVVGGGTVRIDVLLERLPAQPGKLVINANRRGALVSVDGQPAGLTPTTLDVPPGRHRVTLNLEDHAPFVRDITIAAGERLPLNAVLAIASEAEVAAAAKMVQGIEDAPGAITVITGDEIRAFGYRTLGEVLRGVRGFYLSDDRQYQIVGVRGFSPPGDLNNRLLILSDGHAQNDIWAGAAFAGHDFAVDLEDVERIEVVRGPGSALYGTGAFFGVVDITSRLREDHRVEVGGGAGSFGEVYGRAAVAQGLGPTGALRLAGAGLYSPRGATFADPAGGDPVVDNDGERAGTVSGKVALGDFLVLGRYNDRKKYLPTSAFEITPGTGRAYVRDRNAFFETRWERTVAAAVTLVARGYYNRTRYDGRWPYSEVAEEDLRDSGGADWLGAEVRAVVTAREWLRVVAGVEGFWAPAVHQTATDETGAALDFERTLGMAAVYALAEARLPRNLRLTAGVRGDYYTVGGANASPNAAVVWRPYARGISKLMFGRAYRAPSIYELDYHDGGVTQVPSSGLGPETIYTWELEHTHAFGGRYFASVGAYFNDVRNLVNLGDATASRVGAVECTSPAGCVQYQNLGHVGTLGGEVELRRSWGADGSLALAYAFQRSRDLEAGSMFGSSSVAILNSPEHLAYFRLARPIVPRLLVLGAEVLYGGPRLRRDGSRTDAMLLANLTLSGSVRAAALRYSLSVYNLFDWRYGMPVGNEYPAEQQEVAQLGRAFLARLGAAF